MRSVNNFYFEMFFFVHFSGNVIAYAFFSTRTENKMDPEVFSLIDGVVNKTKICSFDSVLKN